MTSGWYRATGERLLLNIHAQPGARQSGIAGLHGDALKVRLRARALEGEANSALIALLAERFGVPVRQVRIVRGEASRRKQVEITGSRVDPRDCLAP